MVLTLHGFATSTCTKRVLTVLKEKNIPYEFVAVDYAKKEHKSAAYLEKQPFGQVPYLVDDGFVIYESRAIARYIALKYKDQGTPLIPDSTDIKKVALFEQAASVELSQFDPYASGVASERIFKPIKGEEMDEKRAELHVATLDAKLNGYEAILSKQKYLAGEELTLADLFHLPYGALLKTLNIHFLEDADKRPNVARWWKDITSRATWQSLQ